MPIEKYTPEQQKAIAYFKPYMDQAVRKVNDVPNGPYHISAFVWKAVENQPPVLIHFNNIPHTGVELIQLHYDLASIASVIDATDAVERSEIKLATRTQTTEEIADRLAVALLAAPIGSESDDIKALLAEYLQSRQK